MATSKTRRTRRSPALLAALAVVVSLAALDTLLAASARDLTGRVRAALERSLGVDVRFGRVRVSPLHGLVVEDVAVGGDQPLLTCPRLVVAGDLLSLAQGRVERVELHGARLVAERLEDGTWRGADALGGDRAGGAPAAPAGAERGLPVVEFIDGTVTVVSALDFPGVSAQHFQVHRARVRFPSGGARLEAELQDPLFQDGRLVASASGEELEVSLHLARVRLTDQTRRRLLRSIERPWNHVSPEGTVDVDARFVLRRGERHPVSQRVLIRALDCAGAYRGFPYRVERVHGTVALVDQRLSFHLDGARGAMRFSARGELTLGHVYPGAVVDVEAQGVVLDTALREALGERERAAWDTLSPAGVVDARVHIEADEGTPGPRVRVRVEPRDASFQHAAFPYPVRGVGAGVVEVAQEAVRASGLVAHMGQAQVTVDASIVGPGTEPTLLSVDVEARDLSVDERLVEAFPDPVRSTLRDLGPGGRLDASVRLRRQGAAPMDVYAGVRLLEGRFAHREAPYPVTGLTGLLELRDGVLALGPLAGRAGDAPVEVAGRVADSARGGEVALRLEARGLSLDERLGAALPEAVRGPYGDLQAAGAADLVLELLRAAGEEGPPRLALRATVRDTTVRPVAFPLAIEGVAGELEFSDGRLSLRGFTGRGGGSHWTARGDLGGGPRPAVLRLAVRDLSLDEGLHRELTGPLREVFDAFSPRGVADAELTLRRTAEGATRPDLVVRLREADVRPRGYTLGLSEVAGEVRYDGEAVRLVDLSALGPGGAAVALTGSVGVREGSPVDVHLVVPDLMVDAALVEALAAPVRDALVPLTPRGLVALGLDFSRGVTGGASSPPPRGDIGGTPPGRPPAPWGGEVVCRATCRLRGVAVVPESFPLALEGLEGVVIADGREIRLEAVRGRSGAATLEATGTLRPADGGFVGTLDLGVQDLALDDGEWYRALPEPARRVWDRLRPSGVVDLRAGLVGLEGVEGLRWSGRLDLHDVDLDTGVDLRACEGALDFLGGSTPGGAFPLWLEGQVDLARCTVLAHHLLEDARADLRLGHQAIPPAVAARMAALDVEGARRALLEGEPAVAALTGLTARCMGGSLAGEVRVALDGPALYAGELHLAGADAAQVLRPAGRPSSGEVSGRVQGDLAFAGVGDAREGLSGVGRLRVRDARLWELPLLVGVLNVLSLKAPDTTFFREVDLRFRLEGSRIALDSLRAESDAISLDGSGSVSGDGQLSLKLYTELGQSMLHRVPVVGEVWKFIKGNVVHLKVTGTVDDPHVEPVLLDAVTTPVRRAMEEGGGARPEGEPPAGGGNGERR